ncbi:MAG TPA: cell division protein FtsZ [Chitinophagaceae bacterium]|nr:cell division protein FtsZ [Chitinophagaceae bacterium]
MIHFDLPKQKSSIIKVLGVGGGGSNAVNYMFAQDTENVDFIICNTDVKALEQSKVPNKIQLGPQLTQGLGAGANPEVGKQATEESLEEIKRILEVNTKMAFITAGMGGGTGTGGAPIMAKICRDLGILTVGIVTTPFGFEGPRRLKQAEDGIRQLQPYVDTLLVISNDKLRMQYGDLKLRDAFSKADNVLATAAKCITDIINSRGHIIVDFADVCTVMKNGGVAILGSASAEGENRAQTAIEEALNSPLLNDSEIFGAKWILININSAEGDHECTMDELEIINHYLRSQAGPDTDVIVGMGYDNTLDRKLGITLIATGFEHKDPFAKPEPVEVKEQKEEKIVMTLGIEGEERKMYNQQPLLFEDKDPYAPRILEEEKPSFTMPVKEEPVKPAVAAAKQEQIMFELKPVVEAVQQKEPEAKPETADPLLQIKYSEKPAVESYAAESKPAIRSGFLSKPMHIYSDEPQESTPIRKELVVPVQPSFKPEPVATRPPEPVIAKQPEPVAVKQPEPAKTSLNIQQEAEENFEFTYSIKDEAPQPQAVTTSFSQNAIPDLSEEEEQRRKAADRINKLRNISFNMNTNHDVTGEFDNVPAYVRRNMELFGNTLTSVENYYSKYTVKKEENNNQAQISTINKFFDEKKPD